MSDAQQIVLARMIDGVPVAEDFALEAAAMPQIGEGELLVRTHILSLDPYIGSVIKGRHMSGPPPQIGGLIPGQGLGEVLESRAEGFAAGDFVVGETGWRTHAAVTAATARKIDASIRPLSLHQGVAGMPGLTAFASAVQLAEVREGDTVLVSSAAGPVGGTVGQIARIKGAAKVVGIAGGAEKCALVVERYGFDACVDYKAEGWKDQIAALFPEGITYYHDNVGGEVLDTALANLALYGRIVLCGLASQYNATTRPVGPNPGTYIGKRAKLMGLVVYDFMAEMDDWAHQAAEWIALGKLSYVEDIVAGIESTPAQFARLMQGANIGKTLVDFTQD